MIMKNHKIPPNNVMFHFSSVSFGAFPHYWVTYDKGTFKEFLFSPFLSSL